MPSTISVSSMSPTTCNGLSRHQECCKLSPPVSSKPRSFPSPTVCHRRIGACESPGGPDIKRGIAGVVPFLMEVPQVLAGFEIALDTSETTLVGGACHDFNKFKTTVIKHNIDKILKNWGGGDAANRIPSSIQDMPAQMCIYSSTSKDGHCETNALI